MAEKSTEKAPGAFSLLGTASTMGLHMVSGPVVGGGLGWLVDHWLGSWPIASSIGFLLGLAAGFRNVWADARYLERSNAAADAEKKKQEQKAALNSASKAKKRLVKDEKAASAALVPSVHKAEEKAENEAGYTLPAPRTEEGSAPSDPFTASLFAGTAAPAEKDLEELDETIEAIRRVLEGDDGPKGAEKAPENGGKGAL